MQSLYQAQLGPVHTDGELDISPSLLPPDQFSARTSVDRYVALAAHLAVKYLSSRKARRVASPSNEMFDLEKLKESTMKRILLAVGMFTGLVLGSTLVNTPDSISPERSVRAESAVKSVPALRQQFVAGYDEDAAECDVASAGTVTMCRALGGSESACEEQRLCAWRSCMKNHGYQFGPSSVCPDQ